MKTHSLLQFVGFSILCSIGNALPSSIPLPAPPGPFAIGKVDVQFTDPTRYDLFAPSQTARSLMLHLRYPISPHSTANLQRSPYIPALAATYLEEFYELPTGAISLIQTNSFQNGKLIDVGECDRFQQQLPILLFSPGAGSLEVLYSVHQEFITSWGYITIGVDHTYDSQPVEFPDGSIVFASPVAESNTTLTAIVRTQDVISIAKHITSTDALSQWIPGYSPTHRSRPKKLGIFGHSLGGETAALAVQNHDTPFGASCSLDGPSVAELFQKGLHGPFLFEGAKLDTDFYQMLSAVWSKITGWKLAVGFQNTSHDDFSDLATLVLAVPGINVNNALGVYAYPDPVQNFHAMSEYVNAFFDFALLGRPEDDILRKPDKRYPEVVFENPT